MEKNPENEFYGIIGDIVLEYFKQKPDQRRKIVLLQNGEPEHIERLANALEQKANELEEKVTTLEPARLEDYIRNNGEMVVIKDPHKTINTKGLRDPVYIVDFNETFRYLHNFRLKRGGYHQPASDQGSQPSGGRPYQH